VEGGTLDVVTPPGLERRVAWCIAAVFVASNVYYFHRWVFRFNNAQTSPTYETTPFVWQAGKYVLMAVAALGLWAWLMWQDRDHPPWWRVPYRSTGGLAGTLAWFLAYGGLVVLAAVRGAPNVRDLAAIFFFLPVVLALPAAPLSATSMDVYRRAGLILVGYHAVFTAVQLWFYFVSDRLPALAYAGGLVRFGGGLDDPNGFGVMVVLPILLTLTMWREFRHPVQPILLLVVLGGMLFLTLSFSAAAALVVGLLALSPITRRPRILVGVLIAVAVAIPLLLSSGYIRDVVQAKSRSAWGRLDFGGSGSRPGLTDHLSDLTPVRLLFGAPRDNVMTENSYIEAFANLGLIGLVTVVVLVAVAIRRGLHTLRLTRASDQLQATRLYEGLTAYLVAFAVGSLGIPYFSVFPANFLFWLVAMLAALGPHLVGERAEADLTAVSR
jgi:hypothetical protein